MKHDRRDEELLFLDENLWKSRETAPVIYL
jgi:hypothetical protein